MCIWTGFPLPQILTSVEIWTVKMISIPVHVTFIEQIKNFSSAFFTHVEFVRTFVYNAHIHLYWVDILICL